MGRILLHIKATNVLLKEGRVKLADFGFAKIMHDKDFKSLGQGLGRLIIWRLSLYSNKSQNIVSSAMFGALEFSSMK
jgi:serine/threonine protein kinase